MLPYKSPRITCVPSSGGRWLNLQLAHDWRPRRSQRIDTRLFASRAFDDKIHILGVGNLGKFVAHSISKQSPSPVVTLLFHRQNLVSQWEDAGHGIECVSEGIPDTRTNFEVDLLPDTNNDTSGGSMIKYLIVATKTYATTTALRRVKHRLDGSSTVLLLQNGMGTVEEVLDTLFSDITPSSSSVPPQFWTAICSFGVYNTAPFSIVHAGRGTMLLGPTSTPRNDTGKEPKNQEHRVANFLMQRLVDAPELEAEIVSADKIREAQLQKLVINAMINPLTAIFRCKNGELFGDPARLAVMKLLLTEAGAIVRAILGCDQDTPVFSDSRLTEIVLDVAEKTAKNTSSMLQDVLAKRRTEIDYINGYIVSQGKKLGLECRNNETIVNMVKEGIVIRNDSIVQHFH